jgi:Rho-binding antiterminator
MSVMGELQPDGYVSISCIEHERLEFAVLRRQKLRLSLRDESGNPRTLNLLPTDVFTRDQAEWLSYVEDSGVLGIVRLDRIVSAVAVSSEAKGSS